MNTPKKGRFMGCSRLYRNGGINIPKNVLEYLLATDKDHLLFFHIQKGWMAILPRADEILENPDLILQHSVKHETEREKKIIQQGIQSTEFECCYLEILLGSSKLYPTGKITIPLHVRQSLKLNEEDYVGFYKLFIDAVGIRKMPPMEFTYEEETITITGEKTDTSRQ